MFSIFITHHTWKWRLVTSSIGTTCVTAVCKGFQALQASEWEVLLMGCRRQLLSEATWLYPIIFCLYNMLRYVCCFRCIAQVWGAGERASYRTGEWVSEQRGRESAPAPGWKGGGKGGRAHDERKGDGGGTHLREGAGEAAAALPKAEETQKGKDGTDRATGICLFIYDISTLPSHSYYYLLKAAYNKYNNNTELMQQDKIQQLN